MCGIAGFVLKNPIASGEELRARVQAMSSLLVHRGPDATGDWVDTGDPLSGPGTLQFTDTDTLLTNYKFFYRVAIRDE